MVTADDYASLIDPTRPNSTRFDPTRPYKLPQASHPHWGMGIAPGLTGTPIEGATLHLGTGAGVRLDAAKVATAPDCRYQIAPLTIDHEQGPTAAAEYLTDS